MEMASKLIRWSAFTLLLLIVAGAGLEGQWLTWITGVLLALFLTFKPSNVKEKTRGGYWLPLLGLVVMFVAGSTIEMG